MKFKSDSIYRFPEQLILYFAPKPAVILISHVFLIYYGECQNYWRKWKKLQKLDKMARKLQGKTMQKEF